MQRKPWTPDELAALRHLYPDWSAAVVGKVLGRKPGSVHQKAAELGLKKSAAFLASDASRRIQRGLQHPNMVGARFKPGQAPWNKGVAGSTGLHPNCRATQFKKGRAPQEARNYAPIGSLRLNKDGHLERKMTDDPTLAPVRRWTPVYRLVWEAANGPIPAKHLVRFRPGQKTAVLEQIKAQVSLAVAMKSVADTLVDTARVEVDYIKATGADRSHFLESGSGSVPLPNHTPQAHNPFPVSVRHALGD